jgi:imidazoleglycerol-phosphate dehydratase
MRIAEINRETKETKIKLKVNVDGTGLCSVASVIGFLDHMLNTFAKHGLFDISGEIKGDIHVDQHHVIEDTGIALGQAFKNALANKKGIERAGFFIYPMDETLAMVAIDISGRPYLKMDAKFKRKKVGDINTDLIEDFLQGFAAALEATVHVKIYYGRSDHHKAEAIFKALGKALKQACEVDQRVKGEVPSTKGML